MKVEKPVSGDVYIGRAMPSVKGVLGYTGYFGNPFKLHRESDRDAVIEQFRAYAEERMANDPLYAQRVKELKGKRLFCWCAPCKCHGDVLQELAERE